MSVKTEASLKNILADEFDSLYFGKLASFVRSAYCGFFDRGHFRKANEHLVSKGFPPINW